MVPCTVAGSLLLFVVVAELADDEVALLQRGQDFVQTATGQERAGGESTFGVVADADTLVEPAGNHLSPRSPRLVVLVDDGRVAAEIDGRHFVSPLNVNGLHGRHGPVELQRQLVVPGQVVFFAVLDAHTALVVNPGRPLVDRKGHRLGLTLSCDHVLGHQAPSLGAYGGFSRPLLGTEHHADAIVAVRHVDREVPWLCRLLLDGRRQQVVAEATCLGKHRLRLGHVEIEDLCCCPERQHTGHRHDLS